MDCKGISGQRRDELCLCEKRDHLPAGRDKSIIGKDYFFSCKKYSKIYTMIFTFLDFDSLV